MRENEYRKALQTFKDEYARKLQAVEQEYQENMRVLERLYAMSQPAPQPADTSRTVRERKPGAPDSSPRRGQIYEAIREVVDSMPGNFDFRQIHAEVCRRLQMGVNLSSVSSGLIKMAEREGTIEVVKVGTGRGATIYRRSGPRLAAVQ